MPNTIQNSPLACRALVALLYSPPSDTVWEGFEATIRLSSMANMLGTRPPRLREALRSLAAEGLLDSLELGYGWARMRVHTPAPLSRLLN